VRLQQWEIEIQFILDDQSGGLVDVYRWSKVSTCQQTRYSLQNLLELSFQGGQ
jgi:hypothetical protein